MTYRNATAQAENVLMKFILIGVAIGIAVSAASVVLYFMVVRG